MFRMTYYKNYNFMLAIIALLLAILIVAVLTSGKPTQTPPVLEQTQAYADYSYDDEMRENMKEYQLECLMNGDIVQQNSWSD